MIIKNKGASSPEIINNNETSGIEFYSMITASDGAPNFAMRLFEIKPGGHTPRHQHDWEHEVYVISGDGHVLDVEKRIKIGTGDFIFVNPLELHQFQAGDNGMAIICVVPNKGQPCADCGSFKNLVDDITRKVLRDLDRD